MLKELVDILIIKTFLILSRLLFISISFISVSYGCETWSLTLREERKLRVFANRVLRRICRP
jgi:hypothetical protein